jgi:hypothetical protein
MKKWIAWGFVCIMLFLFVSDGGTKASEVTWQKRENKICPLDKIYTVDFDTNGVIYGYYKEKVALMDGHTGKLMKTTGFTEINEVRKNRNEDGIDVIVGKEEKGKLFFGLMDQTGNTLIPADKYTELYGMKHGYRAIDLQGKTYFITRTGEVLYTYEKGEAVKEYDKFFVAMEPTYPEGSHEDTEPASVEMKGIYDYHGGRLTEIPEADKTAENQYWIIYNSVIRAIKEFVERDIKERIPQGYTEEVKVLTSISPMGNCYIAHGSVYGQDPKGNQYVKGNYYLYDRKGNLLEKADELRTVDDTYVVCRTYAPGENNQVQSATLYDTKTYRKTENTDMKDGNVWRFGDYFLTGILDDVNYITEPSLFDGRGKFIRKFDDHGSFQGDYFVINNSLYYNRKMEEVKIKGSLYRAGDGYVICQEMSDNKVKWKFTDMSLNIITEAVLPDYPSDHMDALKYKILSNKTGVYFMSTDNGFREYVMDTNGNIIYSYKDNRPDANVFIKSKGATNWIVCNKMPETMTPGKVGGVSVENTGRGEATVTWEPVKGVTGYQVEYKNDEQTYVQNVKTKGTSIALTGLEQGKAYSIRVRAYIWNGNGQISGKYSSFLSVKIAK